MEVVNKTLVWRILSERCKLIKRKFPRVNRFFLSIRLKENLQDKSVFRADESKNFFIWVKLLMYLRFLESTALISRQILYFLWKMELRRKLSNFCNLHIYEVRHSGTLLLWEEGLRRRIIGNWKADTIPLFLWSFLTLNDHFAFVITRSENQFYILFLEYHKNVVFCYWYTIFHRSSYLLILISSLGILTAVAISLINRMNCQPIVCKASFYGRVVNNHLNAHHVAVPWLARLNEFYRTTWCDQQFQPQGPNCK